MGIRFACHLCDRPLNIKNDLAGKVGVCPHCRGRIRIPLTDADKSEAHDQESGSVSAVLAQSSGDLKPTAAASSDSGVQWYVRPPSGGQFGPASETMLQQWIQENRITAASLVWREGWSQWRSAVEALPQLKLPAAAPTTAATASRQNHLQIHTSAASSRGGTSLSRQADRRDKRSQLVISLVGVSVLLLLALTYMLLF